jgi:serine/threonine protein kinase
MAKKIKTANAHLKDIKNVTGQLTFHLSKVQTRIGRSSANDFVIPKNTISSTHALIEYMESDFYLTDCDSTNKTRLNGKTLSPHSFVKLSQEDDIQFDIFNFTFVLGKKEAETPKKPVGRGAEPPMASGDENAPSLKRPKKTEVIEKHIIGKYETISKLGKGGFGTVYKALDSDGKIVAIKLLNPESLEDDRAVRKFFHEAIILSQLHHPNITQFVDFFPKDKDYAIVMDYEEGADLKALLKINKGPLPFGLACKIAHQVLDAFQYAHEKKILHRDIKPENIILDTNDNAKIMDFGIAKMASAATQKTAFTMVSPLYTSPERFDQTREIGIESDIYSLGLVFYKIFTGRHPIKETNPSKIIFAHINLVFDPPEKFADIPNSMNQAILKALEKDPADRFQDFKAFREALLEWDGKSTIEHTGPIPARLDLPARENQGEMDGIAVPQEYFQVGSAILNLFADTLKKSPQKGSSFTLQQNGMKLKLTVDTADGEQRSIVKDMQKILESNRPK